MDAPENAPEDAVPVAAGLTRRQFVTRCAAAGAGLMVSGLTGCGTSYSYTPTVEPENSNSGLKELAGAKSLLFGAATMGVDLETDPAFASAFATHAGLLVPENELKWDYVEPQPGEFNFTAGDYLAEFAAAQGMAFRGHNLVWHQQTPGWAGVNVSAAVAEQQLVNHITETVGHYAGRMHSWDVVNEALNPGDGRSDYLRKTRWLQALGPGYIELAFRAAAAADQHAALVYNDYGFEWDSGDGDRRRAGALKLLSNLLSAGAPVNALGIEAHLRAGSGFAATKLTEFMQRVADLSLQIFITELDVSDNNLPADLATRDGLVANAYQDFLETVLKQPAVTAVLTWGLSDRYTWLSSFAPRWDGLPVRPLPLDSGMRSKPALWAVMNAINGATPRVPAGGLFPPKPTPGLDGAPV